MEQEKQDSVTTTTDEEVVLDETTEDVVTLTKEEYEALQKKADALSNVVARAKAAEAKLKEKPEAITNNNSLSAEDVDVKILESQGKNEDQINLLKKIAKINGTSILAAQSDEIYLAYVSKQEAKERSEKASIGASRGSGNQSRIKEINTPGLSDQEHKELWRKQNGIN